MRPTNLARAREVLDLAVAENVKVIVNREEWTVTLKGSGLRSHKLANRKRWHDTARPWKADILALLTGDPWLYL